MSHIINVAIVLITIFIGLAVVCSFVQEQIAFGLKQRGKTLFQGIVNLLAGHAALSDAVWNSTLVRSGAEAGSKPSYVEARNFSLSLWQNVHAVLGGTAGAKAAITVDDPKKAVANLAARVEAFTAAPGPELELQRTLVALLTEAGNDYDKLLQSTDQWFDAQMDRIGGWYKRWAQLILIVIAFVVVVVSGIDTIDTAKQLYASSATQAAADDFSNVVRQHQGDKDATAASKDLATALDKELRGKLSLHVFHPIWTWAYWHPFAAADIAKEKAAAKGATGATTGTNASTTGTTPATTSADTTGVTSTDAAAVSDPYAEPSIGWHLFGTIITIIAVSLGAPFWFDLLKCIVNVRMAGTRPDDVPSASKTAKPPATPTVVLNAASVTTSSPATGGGP